MFGNRQPSPLDGVGNLERPPQAVSPTDRSNEFRVTPYDERFPLAVPTMLDRSGKCQSSAVAVDVVFAGSFFAGGSGFDSDFGSEPTPAGSFDLRLSVR